MALKKNERRIKNKSLATAEWSSNYKKYFKIPRICNLFFHAYIFSNVADDKGVKQRKFSRILQSTAICMKQSPLFRLPPQQLL